VYSQNIPVPPWEYRTNTNVQKELGKPESLNVVTQGAGQNRTLRAGWLPVPGAEAYSVEYSLNGLDYVNLGRSNINFAVIEPSAFGQTWVRVNAVSDTDMSPWAVWKGDTGIMPPPSPEVSAGSYVGGTLPISWKAVPGATGYVVRVFKAGELSTPVRAAKIPAGTTAWLYTLGMGLSDGGPFRELHLDVSAVNAMGSSEPTGIDAADPPPAEIRAEDIESEVGTDALTLTSVGTTEEDVTGYVLARGQYENFTTSETVEIRNIQSLPYTWTGLIPGMPYYFRIAAKDSFFDATQQYISLQYSGSFEIITSENNGAAYE
jgi:hypothetical protein